MVDNLKDAWLKGEPSLEEAIADPIVELVLEHSGLTVEDLRELLAEVMAKLRNEHPTGGSITLPQELQVRQLDRELLSLS